MAAETLPESTAGLGTAWSTSADAAQQYLRARAPYQQFLIDFILGYHANVGTDAVAGPKRVPQYGAVLDLGCGPGQLAVMLSHHFRKVYARDISDKMLDNLRAIVRGALTEDELRDVGLPLPSKSTEFDIRVGNEIDLNIPDNSIDMIVMGACAHWFDWSTPERSRKIWDTWTKILKPGGTVIITGAAIDPGHTAGPLADAARPLRQIVFDVAIAGPVAHYYSDLHREMAATLYAKLPMPWDRWPDEAGRAAALTTWPKQNRLFVMFDFCDDLDSHGYRDDVQSDPYPSYMPRELERFVSTPEKVGDAHAMTSERFKTITPRRVAAWLRSASGYVRYFDEHPEDKKRIGQDDDLAARTVKEACAKGGLDYDQEIELHHRTALLALAKTS